MNERNYPAEPAEAGLALFVRWVGGHFARSTRVVEAALNEGVLQANISIGRRWNLQATLLDTLSTESSVEFEAARAVVERRLDAAGRGIALWMPRGAGLPAGEPGLSQFMLSIESANALPDGRLEVRRPVRLYLRRTSHEGSVVTILGGLSPHWAQFTNRVAGSFQLNSQDLYRLPHSSEEREELADRIVLAAGQPGVDDQEVVDAEDTWTANELGGERSYVLGSPQRESDDQSAALRRNLRKLLRAAAPGLREGKPDGRALVVLGAATYAEEEKLSWALRGMDPSLYAGYDIITVLTDGLVKVLLEPPRQSLPWDAPFA